MLLAQCCSHTGKRWRGMLRLPGDGAQDGRDAERGATAAICFCHRRLITRGFVCSVCLTVLCAFQAQCPTCGSRFMLEADSLPVTRPPPPRQQPQQPQPQQPPPEETAQEEEGPDVMDE